jgi:8-oxo-dGTP diphosphatase
VTLLVVRHAKAGHRELWQGDDDLRPLSKRGREQAGKLVELVPSLAARPIARVLSSPSVRCRQTVEPLAARLALPIEDEPRLAEGHPLDVTMSLLAELGPEVVVLCSHGDIIGELVWWLSGMGLVDEATIGDADLTCAKGSTWVVERDDDGHPTLAWYVAAP